MIVATLSSHTPRHPRSSAPRTACALAGTLLLALPLGCGSDEDAPTYASWAASPQDYAEELPFPGAMPPVPLALDDQTLRQLIHTSQGGDAVRIQLSNLFGTSAVSIDSAGVALSTGAGAIEASTHVPLTFGGSARL